MATKDSWIRTRTDSGRIRGFGCGFGIRNNTTVKQLRNEQEMHSIHIHNGQTYQITMQNPV